jgi:ribonuclease PH
VKRSFNRAHDGLRPVDIETGYLHQPAGSALISVGNTRVICAASVVKSIPGWMREQKVDGGWLTCEYQMMPASTSSRKSRETLKPQGRTQEIQRLIGRSLRSVVDLSKFGPNTVYLDCDVLDADGGTRCASISGASVALQMAFKSMLKKGEISEFPIIEHVAAVSVGMVDGTPILDLDYNEDSSAGVDMNVVMTESGKLVEVQGTAEGQTFSRQEMDAMLDLAEIGIQQIIALQKQAIESLEL